MIKPKRISPGDTIGIVAPASPPGDPERIRYAFDLVESLGFKVKAGKNVFARNGYLAGTDSERVADLNELFADDTVDAIFCVRGGYGASRLLPMLDFDLIRANPKVLMGYSDITSLLMGIHACCGLVTFHGQVANHEFSPYTLESFKKLLLDPQPELALAAPPPFEPAPGRVEWENRLRVLSPGCVRGPLLGGNLTLVSHLIGTPYLPDLTGAILFLEDVGEATYSIDRMLTQLHLSGALGKLAGLAFGKFTEIRPSEYPQDRVLEDVLAEYAQKWNIPTLYGLMIGHIDDQAVLPVGCLAELDASGKSLRLLEPAVI
jgi:muramoyltetrapeptide carboxypeptidase